MLLRQAVVLLGLGASTVTDIKKGLIYDTVTYPMIAIGIIINLFDFQAEHFLIPGIVFALGFSLYYLGKIGVGDVKIFTAMALLLPFFHGQIFILHSLLAAAIISVIFLSSFYVIKYARLGINFQENKKGIINSSMLGIAMALFFLAVFQQRMMPLYSILVLFVPLLFALVFMAFQHGIRKNFFLKNTRLL